MHTQGLTVAQDWQVNPEVDLVEQRLGEDADAGITPRWSRDARAREDLVFEAEFLFFGPLGGVRFIGDDREALEVLSFRAEGREEAGLL